MKAPKPPLVPPLAINVACPASPPKTPVSPPRAPSAVPPLATQVALAAVELSQNRIAPPEASFTAAPSAVITALPPLELVLKFTEAEFLDAPVAGCTKKVAFPAVDVLKNRTSPLKALFVSAPLMMNAA